MKKATIQLEDLACPSCAVKIEGAVKNVDGVEDDSVKVLFNASKVKLNFDDKKTKIEDIENSIEKIGYEVKKSSVR
ncbi:MAG: heavy-metal-associated domain-containing protein [Anaerococcus sp.]|nr:heavy-metal-associated domain-containing protein [Peptoniphilaceae bacterium]MDY3055580.1 heavy-metal-associated domain-containing protein [Anaerococcus sp.]